MGGHWTEADVTTALELYNTGWTLNRIAKMLSRSPRAVCYKLSRLPKRVVIPDDGSVKYNESKDSCAGDHVHDDDDDEVDDDVDSACETSKNARSLEHLCQFFMLGVATGAVVCSGVAVWMDLVVKGANGMALI